VRCPSCYSFGIMESSAIPFRKRVTLFLETHYLCIKYTLSMTISYLQTLYVRMCGTIDHGCTCDEYSVLLAKSGRIEVVPEPCQT
jgi:hypothetical protein